MWTGLLDSTVLLCHSQLSSVLILVGSRIDHHDTPPPQDSIGHYLFPNSLFKAKKAQKAFYLQVQVVLFRFSMPVIKNNCPEES